MAAQSDFTELPVPTIARRIQEEKEVADGVAAVVDEHRHGVLGVLAKVMWIAVPPTVLFVSLRQIRLGAVGWAIWGVVLSLLVVLAGSSLTRLPLIVRSRLVTYGMGATALTGIFLFGPLLGVGFVFMAAILFASLLLSVFEAYLFASSLVLGLFSSFYLAWSGASFFRPETNPAIGQWIRLTGTSTLAIYFFAHIFQRVQSGLWSSLAQQIRLRIREKRYVDEREKMVRSAGSVQRLESLGRLAGGIAHDFNNSLVVIQCGLGALDDDELAPGEREEIIAEVNEGVNRAATTARQLLSFAKRNVEEIGVCDPTQVADRLIKESGRLFPANLTLEIKLPPSGVVPPVGLAEFAVEQILLTLITNSCEALGDRAGQVTMEFSQHEETGGLLLRVSDDGPGFSEQIREQVWEPFFTTKGEEHMGLGLSTLWATVRRHGGQVDLASDGGPGATVAMTFPAVSRQKSEPKKRRRESSAGVPSERAVLILEDEAPIRTALRRVLKYSGLEVVEAATVAEARRAMEERRFSLLVSDGVLPDGGVGTFIRDFRLKQRAPVILCSGYLEEDLALEGISKGECSFLPKPFTPDDLTDLVESVLSDRGSSD